MKYELDQLIYYLRNNRIHSANVLSRMQVDNLHDSFACTDEQKSIFNRFGSSRICYATCHGLINECDAYESKQQLLDSIMSED